MLARLFGESWEWAILIGRIVLGVVFIAHGYQKLFQMGVDGIAGFFAGAGIPAALFFAWVVSLTEFLGGIAVLIGLLSRYAALGLTVIMIVAILTTKLKIGLIAPQGAPMSGYEFDLALLALSLTLLLAGPGKLSLERALFQREI